MTGFADHWLRHVLLQWEWALGKEPNGPALEGKEGQRLLGSFVILLYLFPDFLLFFSAESSFPEKV